MGGRRQGSGSEPLPSPALSLPLPPAQRSLQNISGVPGPHTQSLPQGGGDNQVTVHAVLSPHPAQS